VKIFDYTQVSRGGWYCGKKWMPRKYFKECIARWVANSYKTAEAQPDYTGWIAHQCGGCYWFAALDLDYGMCCCVDSPNDGRATFEHGGCVEHSDLKPPLAQNKDTNQAEHGARTGQE